MRWSLRDVVLCLLPCVTPACTGSSRSSAPEHDPDTMLVRVVDRANQPLPHAVVWTLPGKSWEKKSWIPDEVFPYLSNPHELLRRLGSRQLADAQGTVRVPRDTAMAGEHEGLAGVLVVGEAGAGSASLVLDDWRWTVCVQDREGKPVVGVPIGCAPEDGIRHEDKVGGLLLGLTDAKGCLVVKAPGSVEVARYVQRSSAVPDPPPLEFVVFEVEGMYLPDHGQKLSLKEGESGRVTLTLPPAVRVEVRVPDWNGPISDSVSLTNRKGFDLDEAFCWNEKGRHFALVRADAKYPVPVVAWFGDYMMRTSAEVPNLAPGETFPIQMELDEMDIVVRARLQDELGNPASHCALLLSVASQQRRTIFVHADRDGRVAMVLCAKTTRDDELGLQAIASPNPKLIGANVTWNVKGLQPGKHRDVGALTLTRH